MTRKFPYQGLDVTLEDINPDGSLRADFYNVSGMPVSKNNKALADIIDTVKREGSSKSILRATIRDMADKLDMSTTDFELFLSDVAQRAKGPRLQ